ncbi:hypothetical protein [Pseudoalteromonas sp. T1lg76]|uniref:hypothetical protein n=1 Tax=Pseudoalteromonas sp. T1lg76 TaxID=2077103 RepID=UPI000CF74F65|nr:hypothetical protein [Pseudoalteromonas sp. T1lg76]
MLQSYHTRHSLVLLSLFTALLSLTACNDSNLSINKESIDKDTQLTHCCDSHPLHIEPFHFALSAEYVHPESPFSVSLHMPNDAQIEGAKMRGVTMYMGTIPVFFKQIDKHLWQADIMVGACSEAQMVWQLSVDISRNGQIRRLTYPIKVTHP